MTLILSNFKTKRKTFQIFVAFSENLDFKVKSHFIKISIVGVMELFLYKNRCYFVWKKKKYKCKRHYCQLLSFRTLVIVAFDMCEKSFTSACIPWVFLLLPHTIRSNTASTKLPDLKFIYSEKATKIWKKNLFWPFLRILSQTSNKIHRDTYTKSLVNTNSFYTNFTNTHFQKVPIPHLTLWHSRLWSFLGRDTKLERFLAKNQLYSNEITKFWKLE